ncbi:MarR family transcriptional regulator [Gilvibacter sp.]|uniref:MarR family winged helix-turn-helix transcriptional regulator n=1 Tax=Gilvibacter sp. TaxID=2729997 RepID=UPI0025C392DB|nr:MarR family transcriptional regulator [Gilvibacter sp.]NQX78649.1 MarR family transcriptional regulator [Gilvibacter sp.]
MGDISKEIQSKFSSERVKALINVMYTANWINNHLNTRFKPFGISPQQYNILRILRGAGGPMPTQTVKERMIDRAPNATRLMDKLCAKGLMERKPCATDRRVVHVEITKAGLALLDEIGSDPNTHLLKNLSQAEAKQLSALLDKIR